jgi:hypothetical protein
MTDLTELLRRASASDAPMPPATDDLTRARAERHRLRRRRSSWGAAATAAAVAATVGAIAFTGQSANAPDEPSVQDGVVLLSQPLEAGPYTFGTTPEGWHVLDYAHPEFAVVIAPVDGDQNPESFAGKLVIMMSNNRPSGDAVEYEGRTYWVLDSGAGHTRITTMTRPGEPEAAIEIQFPSDAGWSQETMLEFLSTVEVGDTAQPGVG